MSYCFQWSFRNLVPWPTSPARIPRKRFGKISREQSGSPAVRDGSWPSLNSQSGVCLNYRAYIALESGQSRQGGGAAGSLTTGPDASQPGCSGRLEVQLCEHPPPEKEDGGLAQTIN
jgi:hypothetical protein